jgi:general secretion pathway protein G
MKLALRPIVALVTFTLGISLSIAPRAVRAHRLEELHKRESVLRAELLEMRKAIDQYSTERRFPPRSLNQLVEAGYLSEIPLDPITEKRDWEEVITDLRGLLDVVMLEDVHSTSTAVSSEGISYGEW